MRKIRFDTGKLRIRWKIFTFLSGFCALLLLVLWLFQVVFLDSFYRRVKVMEIEKNAASITDNINSNSLSDIISSIAQDSDICIDVINADGIDAYSYHILKDCVIHKMSVQEKLALVSSAQKLNGKFYEYLSNIQHHPREREDSFPGFALPNDKKPMESLVYVKLVKNASGDTLAVIINSIISPVNATVTTLRYQLYFVTAIMVLLSVLLAFLIASRVSKPIEEINKSAKLLAQGNYDINFQGKGFLEIGELSDTLNTAASELNKVENLRRELMANISHDLRTPLSLIYGYAEVMHDFPDEITKEQTQTIMEETSRLSSLVNDILDISKLETGIQQLNIESFDITQSIKTTTERIAELIRKDKYNLTFSNDRVVTVKADKIKISQVFYNLLINAVNYTGVDRTIQVRQVVSDGKVTIEVEDTGEGIRQEDLPYIWDRYYKGDKTHKRALTGTGLGLSIVKKVMELHGGEYGVRSVVGKGSVFWFSLKM